MDRARVWLAVSPVIAAGVLVAHVLAYRLTGTPAGPYHDYLDHTPQLLLVLAVVGLVGAGLAGRLAMPATWPFPAVAVATFVVQEHVERVVHTGELPWLLTSSVFVVGLLLQLPVALVAWVLARRLLTALEQIRPRRTQLPDAVAVLAAPVTADVVRIAIRPLPGRGPPLNLRP